LKKVVVKDSRWWTELLSLLIGRKNIVKMTILPKDVYKFNVIAI
jgi:hypothetical protein